MNMPTVSQYLLPSRDLSQPGSSGTSLVVQWLRLGTYTAGRTSSDPGWGTKIPHGIQCGQNLKSFKFKVFFKNKETLTHQGSSLLQGQQENLLGQGLT